MTRESSDPTVHWGFIGAGQMAAALVRGMLRAGVTVSADIWASDPFEPARLALAETGAHTSGSNADVAAACDVLILAVKPQAMAAVLADLAPHVQARHLVVSIAAGVSLRVLRSGLGDKPRLIRVMPNTPALVGSGAAGYCLDPSATRDDEACLLRLLNAVGTAHRVPESHMDAVTGLSGSGPAFVYQVIEAMADGGVRVGLPRDVALGLAAQTVLGAARMVLETGRHPAQLKDQVASPAGTTIAGLHALERGGLRAALIDAVQAAACRATELSGQS